jgi:hypothetical protein
LGYVGKRPRDVRLPDPQRVRKRRRIRQRVKDWGPRAVLLFEDETARWLFPPLRAGGARRGASAAVPWCGRHARRVVFGAIAVRTGHRRLRPRRRQRGEDFRAFLEVVPEPERGWPVGRLLDEDPSPTAHAAVGLAREWESGRWWLPKRCPEWNALDHWWGHAQEEGCANHQDSSSDHLVECFLRYIQGLSAEEARRKAGILSEDFWLKDECQI